MQHRDAALNSAAAAAHRLQANGVVDDDDDEIEQNLITLQQAEVEQFQSRVDTGTAKASGLLSVLESELSEVTATHGAYPDAESIVQQLTVYTGLEAIAQADGRAGLPVGAAYVREASRYFTTYVLANSEKIRKSDQDNVTSDDSAAAAFPVWLILGDAFVLVWFGVGFIALAWFSRRTFNAGAVAAMLAVLALSGWSLSAVLPAKDRVEGYAAPAGARRGPSAMFSAGLLLGFRGAFAHRLGCSGRSWVCTDVRVWVWWRIRRVGVGWGGVFALRPCYGCVRLSEHECWRVAELVGWLVLLRRGRESKVRFMLGSAAEIEPSRTSTSACGSRMEASGARRS